jgi:hypothetical protein
LQCQPLEKRRFSQPNEDRKKKARPTPKPTTMDYIYIPCLTKTTKTTKHLNPKIATAAFASVSLFGAGLLLSGYLSEGTLAAVSGAVPTVYCVRLARDANDRVNRIFEELND